MLELTELQRDALMETFNIGVGRASRALSQLLGCEIALSVPILLQSRVSEVTKIIDPSMRPEDFCAVSRKTNGVESEVLMLFQGAPKTIGDLINNQFNRTPFEDPRENVVTKIAYLVTESCFDQIEDVVNRSIQRSAPSFMPRLPKAFFCDNRDPSDTLIIVKIDINLKKKDVSGHLLLSFSEKGANDLAVGLDRMLDSFE